MPTKGSDARQGASLLQRGLSLGHVVGKAGKAFEVARLSGVGSLTVLLKQLLLLWLWLWCWPVALAGCLTVVRCSCSLP